MIELLVSLAISLVILGGVYQVFVGSNKSYRANEQFARLQESARFATDIIGRDLRMAGYTGCSRIPGSVVNTLQDTSFFFNFNVGTQGFEYIGPVAPAGVDALDFSPNLDAVIPLTEMVEGSDVLTFRRVEAGDPVLLETAMATSSDAALDLSDTDLINEDDIVMISDCLDATVFQVTDYVSASDTVQHASGGTPTFGDADYPGNATLDLGKQFQIGAEIVKMTTMSYLIRNNPAGAPSLYRADYNTGSTEIVEGVEQMQIRYGIDTNGDRQVDSYVTATGASADWGQVVAVRVVLLFQSEINPRAPIDTATYDLNGDGVNEYDPVNERRMRRVFKATFALRNRLS
ncbi:MAG: PilW family protein [Desulfuromusa sp.]|nr:PilW family protein [Desulfuromusa sp.]